MSEKLNKKLVVAYKGKIKASDDMIESQEDLIKCQTEYIEMLKEELMEVIK